MLYSHVIGKIDCLNITVLTFILQNFFLTHMFFGYMDLEFKLRRGPVGAKVTPIFLFPMDPLHMFSIDIFLEFFSTFLTFDKFLLLRVVNLPSVFF